MYHEGWSWERVMKAAEDEPSAPGNTGTRGLQVVSESNDVSYGRGDLWLCNPQKTVSSQGRNRNQAQVYLRLIFLPPLAPLHPAMPAVGQRVELNKKLPMGEPLAAPASKEG